MSAKPMTVLLVGEGTKNSVQLLQWLDAQGSHCQFARSFQDACTLIASIDFDLVLSEYHLSDRSAFPLLELLEGSLATLFFCTRVEDGSIWVKMLERGNRCAGASVLRSNELTKALAAVLGSTAEHPQAVSAG